MRKIPLPEHFPLDTVYVAIGKAFGSGEHETTASCIEKIGKYRDLIRENVVLDVGTGTGILASVMAIFGPSLVFATEIDREAAGVALKTFGSNTRAGNNIRLVITDVLNFKADVFSFAVLNVDGTVLKQVAKSLFRIMKRDAICVLSGIAWEDNYNVKSAYVTEGFLHINTDFMEDYVTMEFGKVE